MLKYFLARVIPEDLVSLFLDKDLKCFQILKTFIVCFLMLQSLMYRNLDFLVKSAAAVGIL